MSDSRTNHLRASLREIKPEEAAKIPDKTIIYHESIRMNSSKPSFWYQARVTGEVNHNGERFKTIEYTDKMTFDGSFFLDLHPFERTKLKHYMKIDSFNRFYMTKSTGDYIDAL